MIGDLNFHLVDWTRSQAESKGRLLLETLESNVLHPMVDSPTHVPRNIL